MNSERSGSTTAGPSPWQAFVSTLLVTVMSAATVLGAVLLSLHGQASSSQPIIQQPEDQVAERFPTAPVATPPPGTFHPAVPAAHTAVAPEGPTSVTEHEDETPSPPPEIDATPTRFDAAAPEPPTTPRPCGGGAPMNWRLYKVQRGDTLFSLARRHGTTMYWIIYHNCLGSDQLWVGQQLYLPILPTPIIPATPTATAIPSATVTLVPTPSSTWAPASPPPSPTTPLPSPTDVPTLTVTSAPLPSVTATATTRPTPDATVSPTVTFMPPVSPTATETIAPTVDASPTPTSRPPISVTLVPASTATAGASPTPIPTLSPSSAETPTETLEPALAP